VIWLYHADDEGDVNVMFPLEVAPLATGSFALRMEKVTAQKMAAKQKAKIGPSCGKVHHRSFQ